MDKARLVAIALILLTTGTASAEDLVTDRPDATESSSTIEPSLVQIETGFEASHNAGISVVQRPLTLARVGIASFAELRIEPPSQVSLDGASVFTDPTVGAKFAGDIGEQSAAGLIVQSSLPVVNAGSGATLTAIATGATELGPVSAGINLGASLGPITDDGGTAQFEGLATLAFGYGLTDEVGVFLEGFVTIPEEGEVSPVIDGGFTYLLAPWLQLDAYGGAGLTEAAPDWLAGGGLSIRLPIAAKTGESAESAE
jgi:hypothetical protein